MICRTNLEKKMAHLPNNGGDTKDVMHIIQLYPAAGGCWKNIIPQKLKDIPLISGYVTVSLKKTICQLYNNASSSLIVICRGS